MTKTITRDDVLRYLYKETSQEENLAIEKQLLVNTALMEFCNQAKSTMNELERLQLEPSAKIQQKIMDYSESFNFESIS